MNLQQRIDDCLEDTANAHDYDDRQELLTDFVEMELQDQREMCANVVIAELKNIGFQIYDKGEKRIINACLNAAEKK